MAESSLRFNFGEFDALVAEGIEEWDAIKGGMVKLIAEIDADFADVVHRYNPDVEISDINHID